jgi:glycosyltransferase involved in cell wall biosynthesis
VLYPTLKSATLFSFLRARLLGAYSPGSRIAMFGWQTRHHPRWQQLIIRRMRPDLVFVQSGDNLAYLSSLGCRCALIPSGVDTDRFHPVDETCQLALRAKYGLDGELPVVLHVGHLNEGRGVRVLIDLARRGNCQVALVASTSSPQEDALAAELRASGVTVFSDFLPYIVELYQLADCYVFPVVSSDNAIESPLSVFEALACDLPVVSTRFAGLPTLFGDDHPGLTFVDSPSELIERASATAHLPREQRPPARDLVLTHSWESVAQQVIEKIDALPATRGERSLIFGRTVSK